MSLIADALKAAQNDRQEQRDRADSDERERYASSALRSSATVSIPKNRARESTPRSFWISLGLFVAAWAVAAIVIVGNSGPDEAENPVVADAAGPSQGQFNPPSGAGFELQAAPQRTLDASTFSLPPEAQPRREIRAPSAGVGPEEQLVRADPDVDGQNQGPDEEASPGLIENVQRRVTDGLTTVASGLDGLVSASGATGQPLLSAITSAAAGEPAAGGADDAASIRSQIEGNRPEGRIELTVRPGTAASNETFEQALAAQRMGDNTAAIALYRQHLEARPNHAEAYNNLGTVLQTVGNLGAARTAFEQALAANPLYGGAWSNLGLVLQQLGEDREALAALVEAVRLEPANVGAQVNLALLHERRGMYGEARQTLESVLEDAPRHPEAHYALARLLDRTEDYPTALEHYRLFLSYGAGRFPDYEVAVRNRIYALEQYGIR